MRGAFIRDPRRRRAVYLIPNLLTTGNLFCGLFSILAVLNGEYMVGAVAILVALVFDVLDGKSARWTNSTSRFGVEYDSLADLVAFGVAPGLLIYGWALKGHGMLGAAVMFAFVACGALRLARYNVMSATSESRYFIGLPIPSAASVVATFVIFDQHIMRTGAEVKPVLIIVMTLTLAFLMVSTIKYQSFKDLRVRDGRRFSWRAFNYLVWATLALMAIAAKPEVMLFVLFAGYALSGVVGKGIGLLTKAFGRRGGLGPEPTALESKD